MHGAAEDLYIETGLGTHSPGGISVLRPAVVAFLQDQDLPCKEVGARLTVRADSLQKCWSGLDWGWTGLDWAGAGMGSNGLVWSGLDWAGLVINCRSPCTGQTWRATCPCSCLITHSAEVTMSHSAKNCVTIRMQLMIATFTIE